MNFYWQRKRAVCQPKKEIQSVTLIKDKVVLTNF